VAEAIYSFRDKYFFLSNFYAVPVKYKGIVFPTAEHAYQAAKAKGNDYLREQIAACETPGKAKRAGRDVPLPANWEKIKVPIMLEILRVKFQYQGLAVLLIETGDARLVEGNDWGDTFWGVYKKHGSNWLGRLLMQVRDELRQEKGLPPVWKMRAAGPNQS